MKRTFILVILSAAITTGCVDADFSLLLDGPIIAEGEVDDNGTPDDPTDDTITCVLEGVTGDSTAGADNVNATGLFINLEQLNQIGNASGRFGTFVQLNNRLQASDEYAPIGFDQNQRIDQNAVILNRAEASFPEDSGLEGTAVDGGEIFLTGVVGTNDGEFFELTLIEASGTGTNVPTVDAWRGVFGGAPTISTVMEVQAFGTTAAGDEMQSNLLRIPLTICGANCGGRPSTPLCAPTSAN